MDWKIWRDEKPKKYFMGIKIKYCIFRDTTCLFNPIKYQVNVNVKNWMTISVGNKNEGCVNCKLTISNWPSFIKKDIIKWQKVCKQKKDSIFLKENNNNNNNSNRCPHYFMSDPIYISFKKIIIKNNF